MRCSWNHSFSSPSKKIEYRCPLETRLLYGSCRFQLDFLFPVYGNGNRWNGNSKKLNEFLTFIIQRFLIFILFGFWRAMSSASDMPYVMSQTVDNNTFFAKKRKWLPDKVGRPKLTSDDENHLFTFPLNLRIYYCMQWEQRGLIRWTDEFTTWHYLL